MSARLPPCQAPRLAPHTPQDIAPARPFMRGTCRREVLSHLANHGRQKRCRRGRERSGVGSVCESKARRGKARRSYALRCLVFSTSSPPLEPKLSFQQGLGSAGARGAARVTLSALHTELETRRAKVCADPAPRPPVGNLFFFPCPRMMIHTRAHTCTNTHSLPKKRKRKHPGRRDGRVRGEGRARAQGRGRDGPPRSPAPVTPLPPVFALPPGPLSSLSHLPSPIACLPTSRAEQSRAEQSRAVPLLCARRSSIKK
jgi:hypothetical protein